jgi:hypothetical protein
MICRVACCAVPAGSPRLCWSVRTCLKTDHCSHELVHKISLFSFFLLSLLPPKVPVHDPCAGLRKRKQVKNQLRRAPFCPKLFAEVVRQPPRGQMVEHVYSVHFNIVKSGGVWRRHLQDPPASISPGNIRVSARAHLCGEEIHRFVACVLPRGRLENPILA